MNCEARIPMDFVFLLHMLATKDSFHSTTTTTITITKRNKTKKIQKKKKNTKKREHRIEKKHCTKKTLIYNNIKWPPKHFVLQETVK
jgi:hypothetical protein